MRLLPLIALTILTAANTPPATAATGPPESLALIEAMTDAHGGMERWRSAPTVSWVDVWSGAEGEPGPPSRIVVEQGSRRALLEVGDGMHMAWDGERAWSSNWQAPYPPRFYALLNYHFLNLPWVVHDPGVVLSEPGVAKLADDPTEYRTVRVTYEAGVGDTPDDYYVLYIHPETHRLHANEYIVTYTSILPEGVEHTPPHVLVYDEYSSVDGLLVPTRFTIYEEQAVYAACTIDDWSFRKPFDQAALVMPEGAVIDESRP